MSRVWLVFFPQLWWCSDTLTMQGSLLSPPSVLQSLELGQSVRAFRNTASGDSKEVSVIRKSRAPDIYHLKGFLSGSECDQLITLALERGLGVAETQGRGDYRRNSRVAWLANSHDGVVASLARSAGNLLLSPSAKLAEGTGNEDLQCVHYKDGGEFVLHTDGAPRVLTVIYYLNGVGGTYFPLADCEGKRDGSRPPPRNRRRALQLAEGGKPGVHGLLVGSSEGEQHANPSSPAVCEIERGDAVAFYNFHHTHGAISDGGSSLVGELDWRAIHAGLPSNGEKWIANHFFRVRL